MKVIKCWPLAKFTSQNIKLRLPCVVTTKNGFLQKILYVKNSSAYRFWRKIKTLSAFCSSAVVWRGKTRWMRWREFVTLALRCIHKSCAKTRTRQANLWQIEPRRDWAQSRLFCQSVWIKFFWSAAALSRSAPGQKVALKLNPERWLLQPGRGSDWRTTNREQSSQRESAGVCIIECYCDSSKQSRGLTAWRRPSGNQARRLRTLQLYS